MLAESGNIRVFVRWDDDSTIFSGETVHCTICFKNITSTSANGSQAIVSQSRLPSQYRPTAGSHTNANPHPSSRLAPPPSTPTSTSPRRNHRPTSSLSIPSSKTARGRTGSIPWMSTSDTFDLQQSSRLGNGSGSGSGSGNGNTHRRSVSIVSIGSVSSVDSHGTSNAGSTVSRAGRGHGRSSSLQITSRSPVMPGPKSGSSYILPFLPLAGTDFCSHPSAATVSSAILTAVQCLVPTRPRLPVSLSAWRLDCTCYPKC